jgi:hypothetical protein
MSQHGLPEIPGNRLDIKGLEPVINPTTEIAKPASKGFERLRIYATKAG